MGSLTNMIRQATSEDEEERREKERMELLLIAAKSKIESFRNQLDEGFTNPALIEKTQIPGIRAIRYIEQYHVSSANSFSDQVSGHLDAAIDSFFSIGEGKDKKAVQGGIKSIIQTGLSAFIGSTEAGESMDKMYFVVPENNAFIRADVMCWKYHLIQQKLLSQNDTAVAYVLCKSVIDHTAIKLDELIYLVTQALSTGTFVKGDGKNIDDVEVPQDAKDVKDVENWLKEVFKTYHLLSDISTLLDYFDSQSKTLYTSLDAKNTGTKEAPVYSEYEKNAPISWKEIQRLVKCYGHFCLTETEEKVTMGTGTEAKKVPKRKLLTAHYGIDTSTSAPPMSPAKLSDVEAYIDEMIRVWKKLEADR